MESALVTGGAGFIGSHLVRALVKRDVTVRVLDNITSGNAYNLEGLGRKVEIVEGDVRNAVACRNACREVDTVFHLAAFVSVPQSVLDPIQSDAINIGGTLNLLLAARDQGVKRFVFSSSAAIYGETDTIPTPETVLPAPTSPYGVQKLTGEHYAHSFYGLYGLPTVSLRYFNVYGPRQNPHSAYAAAIPKFLTRIAKGEPPIVYGDGEQTRDFCHVSDIAQANILAATTDNAAALGASFNIANGQMLTVNALLEQIKTTLDRDFAVHYEVERPGDIRHSGADITRACEILGYTSGYPLSKGLPDTIAYYLP